MKLQLLDLFCGAGGCSVGYYLAGFRCVGVDNRPMPRYPFKFHQADALEFLYRHGREFDVIHASPPCQAYSLARPKNYWGHGIGALKGKALKEAPDLLPQTMKLLQEIGIPWVVENVVGSPMRTPLTLCGTMFGLTLFRHRRFASSLFVFAPFHPSHKGKRVGENGFVCVAGDGDSGRGKGAGRTRTPPDHCSKSAWEKAMGIDWMTKDELREAIPPAYTEYIGRELLKSL
jgi:DNA (cytosine-5)-methyltransferase 1